MAKKMKQAPALTQRQWKKWLEWLKEHAGARVYFAIFLTSAFGLRCSEALALKREDICLNAAVPKIRISGEASGAKKSPGEVYVRKQHMNLMRSILKDGISVERPKGHKHGTGVRKNILKREHYTVPRKGYIFLSRTRASKPYLHYHAIYDHVRRQAPLFHKHLAKMGEHVSPEVANLRPHSGRATLITELMGEGLVTALSMKYARHAPESYKVHLRYGRLTLDDVKQACDALSTSRRSTKWTGMSTDQLLSAQKEIAKELAVRFKAKKQQT